MTDANLLIEAGARVIELQGLAFAVTEAGAAGLRVHQISGAEAFPLGVATDRAGVGRLVASRLAQEPEAGCAGGERRDGRAALDGLMAHAGYVVRSLRGGDAWTRDLEDGTRIAVWYEGFNRHSQVPRTYGLASRALWACERVGDPDARLAIAPTMTLSHALRAADRLPSPFDIAGTPLDAEYGGLAEALDAVEARDLPGLETIRRNGYPNCIWVFERGDSQVFLIGPGMYGAEYAVAAHEGCDPDEPTAGCSSLDTYGDLAAAVVGYREAVASIQAGVTDVPATLG